MNCKHVTLAAKMKKETITNGRLTEFQLMRWLVDGSSTNFQSFPKKAGTLDVASPTVCISYRYTIIITNNREMLCSNNEYFYTKISFTTYHVATHASCLVVIMLFLLSTRSNART